MSYIRAQCALKRPMTIDEMIERKCVHQDAACGNKK